MAEISGGLTFCSNCDQKYSIQVLKTYYIKCVRDLWVIEGRPQKLQPWSSIVRRVTAGRVSFAVT